MIPTNVLAGTLFFPSLIWDASAKAGKHTQEYFEEVRKILDAQGVDAAVRANQLADLRRNAALADEVIELAVMHELGHAVGMFHHGEVDPTLRKDTNYETTGDRDCPMHYWQFIDHDRDPREPGKLRPNERAWAELFATHPKHAGARHRSLARHARCSPVAAWNAQSTCRASSRNRTCRRTGPSRRRCRSHLRWSPYIRRAPSPRSRSNRSRSSARHKETVMQERRLSLPELFLVAATRGMLGMGAGLLLAEHVGRDRRKLVGGVLVAIGALSTIPLAVRVLKRPDGVMRGAATMAD